MITMNNKQKNTQIIIIKIWLETIITIMKNQSKKKSTLKMKKKTNTKMNQSKKLGSMTILTQMTMIKMVKRVERDSIFLELKCSTIKQTINNNSKRKMNGMMRIMVTVKRKKKFLLLNLKNKKESLNIMKTLKIYLANYIIKVITIQEEILHPYSRIHRYQ